MDQENCMLRDVGYEGFEAFVGMVDGKWKLRIIFYLGQHGVLRYGELKQLIEPITYKMLTAQLRELESDGLIDRNDYQESPPRVEYSLSPMGRDLKPLVEDLCQWIITNKVGVKDDLSS